LMPTSTCPFGPLRFSTISIVGSSSKAATDFAGIPNSRPRASAEAVAAEAAPSAADAGAGGSARVLLVDDDEAVRSTTGMILETMGYEVIACDSGPDALARLDEQVPVDILLTDVAMPGMNGPDLARRVRALRPFLPIVFFSGYADPDSVAGDAIRQRIVRKPFRASELAAHIEAALAEGRAAA